MGILKHLLFWPVTGPSFLTRFSLEKVHDTVKHELTDDARIKEELLALQMELEMGEIDDDEYVAREADLMAQLREVREWREEFGMGIAGGPVRAVLECAGIHDVPSKSLGSSNPINIVHATMQALKDLVRPEEIAARRGLPLEDVAPAAMLRARAGQGV